MDDNHGCRSSFSGSGKFMTKAASIFLELNLSVTMSLGWLGEDDRSAVLSNLAHLAAAEPPAPVPPPDYLPVKAPTFVPTSQYTPLPNGFYSVKGSPTASGKIPCIAANAATELCSPKLANVHENQRWLLKR